jgi:hypothetical protein
MRQDPEMPAADRGPRWEPAVWFVLCLALYTALAHEAFYKTDGPDIVRLFDDHLLRGAPLRHPWHVGFLPALEVFRRVLGVLGLQPGYVQLGDWFSAFGAALGVAAARAGMRQLALPAATARLASLALALCPGTLLFATVVEFHGPLLGMVGVAFWWTCVVVARPTWCGFVGLGVLGHAAFLIDGQALFLPAWLLSFYLARRWGNGTHREDLARAGVAAAVHGVLFLVLPKLAPGFYGFWADMQAGLREEGAMGTPQSLDYAPTIFVQEWLWPLLPVSALVFVAPLRRALRLEFAAFVIGLLPFLYLSVRLLVGEPEHGAYVLPLVLPAALLVAQFAGTRWRAPVALSLLLGLWPLLGAPRTHLASQAEFDAQFARGVAAATGAHKPMVLVGSARELAAAYARLPADELLWVRLSATKPRDATTAVDLQVTAAWLRSLHEAGRAVLITGNALGSLEDPAAAMRAEKAALQVPANETLAGPLLAQHLREHFDLLPAAPDLLRLVPKP